MKVMKNVLALAITIILLFSFSAFSVSAQNVDSANFTVQAIIPDNQINKKLSYFDLKMKPGATQTLHVNVINTGEEDITVDIALRAASTNRNGIIEYQVDVTPDETLNVPFNRIATTESTITLAAKQTKKIGVEIEMPKEKFDGTILGGIVFTKREKGSISSGVSIANQFSYVIGVKLTETTKTIDPDFALKSIEPTLINYRNAVVANIHNTVPLIVKNADVTARVYQRNQTKPLFSVNKSRVDMAPNSTFPLPIEWGGNRMDAGDYTLEVKMTHDMKAYEWKQDFSIEAAQANQMNQNMLIKPIAKQGWWATNWWIVVLTVGALLLVLWMTFAVGRRRRAFEYGFDEDEEEMIE